MAHTDRKILPVLSGVLILSLLSLAGILIKTPAGDLIREDCVKVMLLEAVLFFGAFFAELSLIRDHAARIGAFVLTAYLFLWMHRIAAGILLAGIYLAYLILLGEVYGGLTGAGKMQEAENMEMPARLGTDFIFGACLQLCMTGFLSLTGIGGKGTVRLQVMITMTAAVIAFILLYRAGKITFPVRFLPPETETEEEHKERLWICAALSFVMVMLLIQAGRINIALDYDSLHYGLRTEYILDNGHGIYENLGSVNDVYVYPKGLETLLLPLTFRVTYGPVIAFSWWMTAGTLIFLYLLVKKKTDRRKALYAAACAACIPAIMNMSASAKTDAATLFVQMIALYELEESFDRGQKTIPAFCAAALLSLTMKPTALLFTGVIGLTAAAYVIIGRRSKVLKASLRQYLSALIPGAAAFSFITGRTVLLTGYPVTSAASFLWELAGFRQKYPFQAIDATGGGSVSLLRLVKRLIGLFACPVGEDMSHVYIAWGSLLTGIMAAVIFAVLVIRIVRKKWPGYFLILWAVLLVCVILCTGMLYQVDGNYFMLFYALTVYVFFADVLQGFSKDKADETVPGKHAPDMVRPAVKMLLPAVILSALMCCLTNWAGTAGLTPVSFNHTGFYDHASDRYDKMINAGCMDIYDLLSRDATTRVIALADQPDCLMYPCCVQSYTDLEGSGGNVSIVKTLDGFKEFLDYAKIRYMVVNENFISARSRANDIVSYMKEDGSLELLIDEGENRLYVYRSEKQ